MAENSSAMRRSQPDRYEPLPSLPGFPAWVWRRLPRVAKGAVVLLPFVAVALVLALGPGIERSKDERARAEAQQLERRHARRDARIRARQQPRFGRAAAAADLAGRSRLYEAAAVSVARDARARVRAGEFRGPISRVACEPYPRTVSGVGAHENLRSRVGTYSCLAVTTEFGGNELSEASIIGHPYRVRIDFESGRYAFCSVVGRAGEGSLGAQRVIPVPRVCGGS